MWIVEHSTILCCMVITVEKIILFEKFKSTIARDLQLSIFFVKQYPWLVPWCMGWSGFEYISVFVEIFDDKIANLKFFLSGWARPPMPWIFAGLFLERLLQKQKELTLSYAAQRGVFFLYIYKRDSTLCHIAQSSYSEQSRWYSWISFRNRNQIR
jgi:hypothetical protein